MYQATSGTDPLDGAIANGTLELAPGSPPPLALFTAPRVDGSLHRLRQERPGSLHSRKLRSFADLAFP